MKKFIFIILLYFTLNNLCAQKHDYNWIIGYSEVDSIIPYFGRAIINFKDSFNVAIDTNLAEVEMYSCDVSFSDWDGDKILYYSSGVRLYDNENKILENGDSLCPGKYEVYDLAKNYITCVNGHISLPYYYKDSTVVYLFHTTYGDTHKQKYELSRFWLTKIIFDSAHPLGFVKEKNIKLLDSILIDAPKATKHANGKDWWIVISENFTGKNFCYLLKDGKLQNPVIYDFEEKIDVSAKNETVFSPDGTMFLRHSKTGIILYDFDRCTGVISNPEILNFPSVQYGGGSIFSPNSRWLYLNGANILWQVDLYKFPHTIDTAGIVELNYDGFPTLMFKGELGPDGKIYINTSNATTYMHVINYPDEGCPKCDFVSNAIKIPVYNGGAGLPAFPNYRLGPLDPPCDTIMSNIDQNIKNYECKIFPNPTSDNVRLELTSNLSHSQSITLAIYNSLGKKLYSGKIPAYAYIHDVNINEWPTGIYFYCLGDSYSKNYIGKFLKIK